MPDRRNRYHQRFCTKPACRQASKRWSQAGWLKHNPDYFSGKHQVQRVQLWRKEHPDYGQGPRPQPAAPLQDVLPLQPVDSQVVIPTQSPPAPPLPQPPAPPPTAPGSALPAPLPPQTVVAEPVAVQPSQPASQRLQDACPPLQDVCPFAEFRPNPLLTGLIAHLFDCTLQDDIERAIRRLTIRGLDFLGATPGAQSNNDYDAKKTPPSRTAAPGAPAVQLAGSPPGAG